MSLFITRTCLKLRNSSIRSIHNINEKELAKRYEEVRIPVPWGHIAGRWWGPQDQRPIFCWHGWQESCGSFDPLFSLLPENISLLACDFPGHGFSSRIPAGLYYHGIDASIMIRRIQKYFAWPKISLLGHSMGGITSFTYTALFPNDVDMLIAIDALKPFSNEPGSAIKNTAQYIDKFLRYDALNGAPTKPPAYTLEEMANNLYLSTRKSIPKQASKFVLNRTIEKSDQNDKYYFSRDNRLKVGPLIGMQHLDILEYAKRIHCPMLVMKATKSTYFEKKKYFYDVVDVLKQNNKDFYYKYVEGTHHVHIYQPELVAEHIIEFLNKYNTMDRSGFGIKPEMKIN